MIRRCKVRPAPLRGWRRLAGDRRATALTEFAFVLPVLIALVLGGFQYTQAMACKRRVTTATRALSDMVSQYETITPALVDTILDAAALIMTPFDPEATRSRVSVVTVDSTGKVTVVWSEARNMTPLTRGATFVGLPAAMRVNGTYYVFAETNYTYEPLKTGYTPRMSFNQTLFMLPRKSVSVDCSSC